MATVSSDMSWKLDSLQEFLQLAPSAHEEHEPEPVEFAQCRHYAEQLMQQALANYCRESSLSYWLVAASFESCSEPWSCPELCTLAACCADAVCTQLQLTCGWQLLTAGCNNAAEERCPAWVLLDEVLQPLLRSCRWRGPALTVYVRCLEHTAHPHLSGVMPRALPLALRLLDEPGQQRLALRCVGALQAGAVSACFLQHGHGDVLYSALKPLLYSRNAELLQAAVPCLLALLRRLEPRVTEEVTCRHDELLHLLLYSLALESRLELRRVLAAALPATFEALGKRTLLHMRRILDVLRDSLVGPQSADGVTRLYCLRAMLMLLKVTSPRDATHAPLYLQLSLCCAYDVITGFCSVTPEKSGEDLLAACQACVRQLSQGQGDLVQRVLASAAARAELPQGYADFLSDLLVTCTDHAPSAESDCFKQKPSVDASCRVEQCNAEANC